MKQRILQIGVWACDPQVQGLLLAAVAMFFFMGLDTAHAQSAAQTKLESTAATIMGWLLNTWRYYAAFIVVLFGLWHFFLGEQRDSRGKGLRYMGYGIGLAMIVYLVSWMFDFGKGATFTKDQMPKVIF